MPTMGRASMFRGKENGVRIQGLITQAGGDRFEFHRGRLAALYKRIMKREAKTVSDADVIEYLSRGVVETIHYFQEQKRAED